MGRHGAEPGMRVTCSVAESTEASDDGLIAIHRVEEPADRLGILYVVAKPIDNKTAPLRERWT